MTLLDLLEDWLRDQVVTGLVLLSTIGVIGVSLTAGGGWIALGTLAALAAVAAVFVPLVGHWSTIGTWLTMVTVAVFDVAVILVLHSR